MDLNENFVSQGYVPARGSIAILGTGSSVADKLMGNASGGFGETDKYSDELDED